MPRRKKNIIAQKRKYMWKKNHNDNTTDGAESAQHTNKQAAITNETERAQDIRARPMSSVRRKGRLSKRTKYWWKKGGKPVLLSESSKPNSEYNEKQNPEKCENDSQMPKRKRSNVPFVCETKKRQKRMATPQTPKEGDHNYCLTTGSFETLIENEEALYNDSVVDTGTDTSRVYIEHVVCEYVDVCAIDNETSEKEEVASSDTCTENLVSQHVNICAIDNETFEKEEVVISDTCIEQLVSEAVKTCSIGHEAFDKKVSEDVNTCAIGHETFDKSEVVSSANSSYDYDSFGAFKRKVVENLMSPYTYNPSATDDVVQIIELYPTSTKTSVKLSVTIDKTYHANIFVHQIQLSATHNFWVGLPSTFDSLSSVNLLLGKISSWGVCIGNFNEEYQDTVPVGGIIQSNEQTAFNKDVGYREGDFGAVQGNIAYSSTIRSLECGLLVNGARCSFCSHLRKILYGRKARKEKKERMKSDGEVAPNYLSKSFRHCIMSKEELIGKINQQNEKIRNLQSELNSVQRKLEKELAASKARLESNQSPELREAMAELEKAYPDASSFQRLFWTEQFKSLNVASSKGMRWNPMIIRWCLYLKEKSRTAYETLRKSGCITLPSMRTLCDYSHNTRTYNGFKSNVSKVQEGEVQNGMDSDSEPWKK